MNNDNYSIKKNISEYSPQLQMSVDKNGNVIQKDAESTEVIDINNGRNSAKQYNTSSNNKYTPGHTKVETVEIKSIPSLYAEFLKTQGNGKGGPLIADTYKTAAFSTFRNKYSRCFKCAARDLSREELKDNKALGLHYEGELNPVGIFDFNKPQYKKRMGKRVTNWINNNRDYMPTTWIGKAVDNSPFTGAVAGGVALGTLGSLGGWAYSHFIDPDPENMKKNVTTGGIAGLLAGIAMGGFAGYSTKQDRIRKADAMNTFYALSKTANAHKRIPIKKHAYAMGGAFNVNTVVNQVMNDYSMNYSQKNQLVNVIENLPPQAKSNLANAASGMIGAGAAFAIAKYLLHMGFGGSILMGILGGLAYSSSPSARQTSFNPMNGTVYSQHVY